jgi:large conductance mechanosensitive channel
MAVFEDFKKFAMRGNVIDLAIGVIIGAAFGKIVSSLTEDIITPLILKPALDAAHLSKLEDLKVFGTVKIGVFISAILNFLIVAWALFFIVKLVHREKKKQDEAPAPPPPPPADVVLLTEIRDILKTEKKP